MKVEPVYWKGKQIVIVLIFYGQIIQFSLYIMGPEVPENVPFMSSCPVYTGSNYIHFIQWRSETALYCQ
jgi:hypothetical protein